MSSGEPAADPPPRTAGASADRGARGTRGGRDAPAGQVLAVVAVGGAAGSVARYGAQVIWPAGPASFPWATFGINLVGCGLIGVLMVLVAEGGRPAHPLVRPFLGVGVLGGFTTFSTYALDYADLLTRREAGTALAYAAGTLAGAMAAVWAAATLTRVAVRRGTVRRGDGPDGAAGGRRDGGAGRT